MERRAGTAAGLPVLCLALRPAPHCPCHPSGPHLTPPSPSPPLPSSPLLLQPGKEGPWVTYARMVTLRTPKHLTGLDYGMPSLTFQAYYEARFGAEAWARLDKIPRELW